MSGTPRHVEVLWQEPLIVVTADCQEGSLNSVEMPPPPAPVSVKAIDEPVMVYAHNGAPDVQSFHTVSGEPSDVPPTAVTFGSEAG